MQICTDFDFLIRQLRSFAQEDSGFIPLLSNASALLYDTLEHVNWAGFYLVKNGQLVVGPFQGKPACIHIQAGKGVCGSAWSSDSVQRVDDVHSFPGHIACDSASRSEIVIPLHLRAPSAEVSEGSFPNGPVFGVLDIDSPILARFSQADEEGLSAFARCLEEVIEFDKEMAFPSSKRCH